MKLQHKLFLPLLLIVTIPILVMGIVAYIYILDSTKNALINDVDSVSKSLRPTINEKIKTAESNLRLITSSRLIQDYITRDEQRYTVFQPSLMKQLSEYQTIYPEYFAMKLILENGEIDLSVDNRANSDIEFDASEWLFYQQLFEKTDSEISALVEAEKNTRQFKITLGLPLIFKSRIDELYGRGEEERNFFTLSLYLDYIRTIIDDVNYTEENLIIVTDHHKHIIFNNGQFKFNKLEENLKIVDVGEGFYFLNDNKERFYVSSAKLLHSIQLYVAVPISKFNQSANKLAFDTGLWLSGIILVIFILSLVYIQQLLLAPIYAIKNLVTNIAKGVMDSEVLPTSRKDELSELSESIVGMRGKIQDNNRKIENLAYFDELTGLPNRFTLRFELKAAIARANRSSKKFALIFIDLDNFKNVNDTLGHDVGDELLIEASDRIKQNLRLGDYIVSKNSSKVNNSSLLARLGGDEFTVLIADVIDPSALEKPLSRVLKSLSSPYIRSGKEMSVGASLGVAIFPDDGKEAKDLLKSADLAMYAAKRNGKNCFAFFSQEMNIEVYERQALEAALRNAEKNGELSLHYQPRIKIDDYSVDGFEALLRWNNKDLGEVSPFKFIPIAESNLQILQIGHWVLNQACRKIKHWIDIGFEDFRLAVNVSTIQLYRADLVGEIKAALASNGISGRYLEIEITESALLEDEAQAIIKLNEIKALGVRIALDDFGTGYSSLSLLHSLPIDILKIDQSFVANITDSQDSANVFEAIVQLAKKLHLVTVAEGIEMAKQHELILLSQCDHAQGYYYARPMKEEDADEYVKKSLIKLDVISNYIP